MSDLKFLTETHSIKMSIKRMVFPSQNSKIATNKIATTQSPSALEAFKIYYFDGSNISLRSCYQLKISKKHY
ncbi:hypothetical protein DC094_20090 [Pelagibaculum spongiae]|uniref:Uncharacterized protein n=1 Tax=Pelagibaculum spongiae TaxID=2080658 RepID=A0A2V1GNY8_9GAMM|nr:hypothetical protein DC094_20090 [Pelagibaculum spongiae]